MPNFCVDCKHHWQADENDRRFRWSIEKVRCLYYPEEGQYDLVTGELLTKEDYMETQLGVMCYEFRSGTILIARTPFSCGPEGKFFQKRVDTPKD